MGKGFCSFQGLESPWSDEDMRWAAAPTCPVSQEGKGGERQPPVATCLLYQLPSTCPPGSLVLSLGVVGESPLLLLTPVSQVCGVGEGFATGPWELSGESSTVRLLLASHTSVLRVRSG